MSAVASAAAVLNIFAPPIEVEVTERMPACPWAAAPTEILNSPGAFTGSRASVAVTRTGFPAAKVISIDGAPAPLAELVELLRPPEPYELLGPVPLAVGAAPASRKGVDPDELLERLTLRTPLRTGADLVTAVKQASGVRSARKSDGALRVRVDPTAL